MSNTDKNIDQLFLRKSFHELTDSEKAEIAEIAKTESEFNDTKLMLASIEKEINSIADIEPKEKTKKHLIAEFNRVRPAKATRPMGLGIFFPKDKQFHQKLGVQILAIAAVLALIFTVFIPGKGELTQGTETAELVKDKQVTEEQVLKEKVLTEDKTPQSKEVMEDEMENSLPINQESDKIVDNEVVAIDKNNIVPPSPTVIPNNDFNVVNSKKEQHNLELNNELAEEVTPTEDLDLLSDDMDSKNSITNDNLKTTPTSGGAKRMSDNSIAPSIADEESLAIVTNSAAVEKTNTTSAAQAESVITDRTPVKTSKSLSENKELIKHFYTAM